MATNKNQTATPATDTLAALREQNATDHFDTTSAAIAIVTADNAVASAADELGERLAQAPRIAADVYKVPKAPAALAESIAKAQGIAKNAAEARVSRIVKCGRVLAAHPTLDALAVYAATNRMTGEQIDAIVAAKNADAALKLLTTTKTDNKQKVAAKQRGANKVTATEKTRTIDEDGSALVKAMAAYLKRCEELGKTDRAIVAASLDRTLDATRIFGANGQRMLNAYKTEEQKATAN